jgi:hypothetical protein
MRISPIFKKRGAGDEGIYKHALKPYFRVLLAAL